MKKFITLIAFVAITATTFAQTVDMRRKIDVAGTAEQEVTPDIINVSVSLQEYMNGKTHVTIDQLEQQLEDAVKDAGIPKDDFTIDNVSAWNNTWQKKKTPDFLAGKQYRIRLHDLNKFDVILSKIDPKGIQATNIDSYDYSKMADLKKQLKIQALLAAKDKATYLLNAIGEHLGDAININEADNSSYPAAAQPMFANRMMSFKAEMPESDINFKKIKLSFTVNAEFEIVK
jgi:uncharacterized protein YggE